MTVRDVRRFSMALTACGVLALPAVVMAQHPRADATTAQRPGSQDEAFAREAAVGGRAEVELAQVARQRASSPSVKALAEKIEADHTKANAELGTLTGEKGWRVEQTPDAKHAALKRRLESLEGQAFDRAYLDAMHKDHTKDIAAFRKQAETGSDASLKAFASKTLPHLEEHLRMTEQARRGLGAASQP